MAQTSRYARLLTHHPVIIVVAVLALVTLSSVLCITVGTAPDFSDPLLGFKPRYSDIHSSYYAWKNLVDSTSLGNDPDKLLSLTPFDNHTGANKTRRTVSGHKASGEYLGSTTEWMNVLTDKQMFFCDSQPRNGHSKLAFSISSSPELLSYAGFTQLCKLQEDIESLSEYTPYCESDCACQSFSLVNYVAFLTNHTDCSQVMPQDLSQVLSILMNCSSFLHSHPSECWDLGLVYKPIRCNMPEVCKSPEIFELAQYLMDKSALTSGHLAYTVTYLPLPIGNSAQAFYEQLYTKSGIMDHSGDVRLIAFHMGLKETVFERALLNDSAWIAVTLSLVFIIMWIYTDSLLITSVTALSMIFSLIISFTIYQFIFRISLFPFMNLLTCVVVVGIGADDLFIYWKTWTAIKMSRNASILERIVTYTFKHASSAIFVTSATTATAFYSSAYTDLVTVRCFCIYSGTCVLVHYLLVITLLPACVVLYEKHTLDCCAINSQESSSLCKCFRWFHTKADELSHILLNKLSSIAIISPLWLTICILLAGFGCVGVFYWPRLALPTRNMFQMLSYSHPFEVYDRDIKSKFTAKEGMEKLPLIFVWGVQHQFNGDYFDLALSGHTELQSGLQLSSPAVQKWFLRFCFNLRNITFFDDSISQPSGCFIEEFRVWMKLRSCKSDELCCSKHKFPFEEKVFMRCIKKWSSESSKNNFGRANPGLRFQRDSLAAVIIAFQSNMQFTYSYDDMDTFYKCVTDFLQAELVSSPPSMRDTQAFFTADDGLLFYDVQHTLVTSLPLSLAIILSASSLVILLTTLNFLLVLCSLFTIFCSIITTLGALAALGWQLNILESVIVSLCIGLSMDFPLHVAVAYRIAHSNPDRRTRAAISLQHVGGSISTAMMTTLVAGLCMLPTSISAYQKLGTFLIIVAVSSWLFAVLFMPSLLIHFGPIGSCTQIYCHCCWKQKRPMRQLDRTVYSDEVSSDLATTLAQTVSSHIVLETLHEVEEEEDNSESETNLPDQVCYQLEPIPECDNES